MKNFDESFDDAFLNQFFDLCFEEDCPLGDITSLAIIPTDDYSEFKIIAKEPLILCGSYFAAFAFKKLDPQIRLTHTLSDGTLCHKGDEIVRGYGLTHAILKAERPVLNLIARLCSIATYTRSIVEIIKDSHITLLDTRKTTPLLRQFEKYAVKTGGGDNHRMHMSDMFLIKENHLYSEDKREIESIVSAVKKCRAYDSHKKIVVEIENLSQIMHAVASKVDRIMLDNFSPDQIKQAVQIVNGALPIEVSGGIHAGNIKEYCLKGVDFISLGSLTHSVHSVDISLLIQSGN